MKLINGWGTHNSNLTNSIAEVKKKTKNPRYKFSEINQDKSYKGENNMVWINSIQYNYYRYFTKGKKRE